MELILTIITMIFIYNLMIFAMAVAIATVAFHLFKSK